MHSTFSLFKTVISVTLESFKVAFLSLVVLPAVATALVLAGSSAWSVEGLASDVVQLMAESQQLGRAAKPTEIRVNRCRDEVQLSPRLPQKITCSEQVAVDMPISAVAASASKTLGRLYLVLAAFSLVLVLGYRTIKQPANPHELPNLNLTA